MLLRSGREKPYQEPPRRRKSVKKQRQFRKPRTAPRKTGFCGQRYFGAAFSTTSLGYSNSTPTVEFSLRETVKCYILTEDSKTVHFDIDEDGHHEICTKDSQSHEDIAWLSVFTRKGAGVTDHDNFVSLTQRSKLNEFVLLCKGKNNLSLKVLKAHCSEPDYPSLGSCNHEDPDFKQLSEHNDFFIMHYQGDSVQFQCYEDRNYYLCVNDDSLDIRKMEKRDPNKDKNFYFRVCYLQEN